MIKLFLKIWYRLFPKKQINAINKRLEKAVVDKQKRKLLLLVEIKKYMLNELKIDKKSKFIPLSVRKEVCTKVNSRYGKRMKELNVILNLNLKLILK